MLVGVCGAGTMGLGIALLAPEAIVWDPDADARASAAAQGLAVTAELAGLAACEVVIEAAPEDLELKRSLIVELEAVVGPECVLATNTSSLLVTAVATTAQHPERVVGMHFFNPPRRMELVEVVAGARSGKAALERVRTLARDMGRTPIDAVDGPGFIVNRCNRPFNLEALRLVSEGIATPEQIDHIVRAGGGFRMGPFELMDLVGLDTSLAVQKSFFEQSFGEPRWRPSPLVAKLVAAGRLGRKSGEGFYSYPREEQALAGTAKTPGSAIIAGESALAQALCARATSAGWEIHPPGEVVVDVIVDCGVTEEDPPLQGAPQVILCDMAPLAALDPGGASAGFFAIAPLHQLVELTRSPTSSEAAMRAAERFFGSLDLWTEEVGDAPGLVLGRILAQLANEAYFALGEGVGSEADIDTGMTLGLNHPRGPFAWMEPGEALTIVRALYEESGDDRYRAAPALLRAARLASLE